MCGHMKYAMMALINWNTAITAKSILTSPRVIVPDTNSATTIPTHITPTTYETLTRAGKYFPKKILLI